MRRPLVLAALAALAAGCGGGPRQDADEPSGTSRVEVVRASFPARQHVAQAVQMRLRVRNADRRALDNVAVTVHTKPPPGATAAAFGQRSAPGSGLASSERPVWIVDRGPAGGDTADATTWSAGALRPGETKLLTWQLTAVQAGTYTVDFRVYPGLTGKAQPAARITGGTFRVKILDRPVSARVGPDGKVVRGGR